MKWFSRDLSTVESRATEQRLAIEALQTRQAELALEAVLSGSYHECDQIATQLRTAHEKLKVLQLAEQAVRDKETEAEREANAKEAASRRRALSQHLARLQRSAADYEIATSQAVSAFRAMVEAGQAALQQVGGRIEMYNELSEGSLRAACEREVRRIGSRATHLGDMPWAPGASSASIGGTPIRELEPLSKAISRVSRWCTERFQVTASRPRKIATADSSKKAETPPVAGDAAKPLITPSPETQPQPTNREVAPEGFAGELPRPPASEVVADQAQAKAFRNLEALKNPHAEGTEEHSGFQAALAEMQSTRRPVQHKGDRE